jgi:hypothetical protein
MPTLATRLALAAASAAVVMTGVEAWRGRHPEASVLPPTVEEPAPEPPAPPPPVAASPARPAAPRPAARPVPRGPFAMARIHGRVVGDETAAEEAEIQVEDAERIYAPLTGEDNTFEINLPPGSYLVTAKADNWIALVEVAGLAPNEDREVVLTLAQAVAIRGHVVGCDGPCSDVTVSAMTPAVRVQAAEDATSDHQGEFIISGLAPRHAYDLTFRAAGMRPLTLRGIPGPAAGVVATLEPNASLVGGFGVAPDEECPMEKVSLVGPLAGFDEEEQEVEFDRNCRFRIEDLPAGPSVRLRASGEGWHFDVEVALPEHGDPPFLCLHPPCREPVPEAEASLTVNVVGGSTRTYVVTSLPDQRSANCAASSSCTLDGLAVRAGATVTVYPAGCAPRLFTVNLMPGSNFLTSPCEPGRRIRGNIADAASVRCSSQSPVVTSSRFTLLCPMGATTIEYRLADDAPWQTAAVTFPEGGETPYVRIGGA